MTFTARHVHRNVSTFSSYTRAVTD